MKKCSLCKKAKKLDQFFNNKARPDGLSHTCKKCDVERKRNTKYRRTKRNSDLKRLYGISLHDFELLLKSQGGCCKITQ